MPRTYEVPRGPLAQLSTGPGYRPYLVCSLDSAGTCCEIACWSLYYMGRQEWTMMQDPNPKALKPICVAA